MAGEPQDAMGRYRILRTFGPFEGKEGEIVFDRVEAAEFLELGWIEEVTAEGEEPAGEEAEPAPVPRKRLPRRSLKTTTRRRKA
jgi:hypothetical protein